MIYIAFKKKKNLFKNEEKQGKKKISTLSANKTQALAAKKGEKKKKAPAITNTLS
ncbi:hypothetical protein [Bartonella capreoli]|uniref:hypothetical protein n=1 Tax=Bartonella capreoli TaxID=155192 RepID=UPI001ABC9194|nr:hypothetical protein [Bartonella capreoli]